MNTIFKKINHFFSNNKGGVIIVISFLLLELFSALQYFYTQQMLEDELGKRAESELTAKALIIRGMLKQMESLVVEHQWDIHRSISHADSMFHATKRIIANNQLVKGSFIAFAPNYYPEKGRLFEPYAYKVDGQIKVKDLAQDDTLKDYTINPIYKKILKEDVPFWSDPYDYIDDGVYLPLTTYSYPLHDSQDRFIGASGIDISLDWLGDTLNAHHIYPSSFILLLTEDGKMISSPNDEHVKSYDVEKVFNMINDSTVHRSDSKSGRSKVIRFHDNTNHGASIYYANMRGLPSWQIAVVCYDHEVYGNLHWMGINMLLLMLLVIGILGFLIRRYMRNEQTLSLAKADRQRINNELQIATKIQKAMLVEDKETEEYPGVTVSALLQPAKEVGGDLYNYFVRNEKLFFCIGDVSGKGIPSSLVMAMTQALIKAVSAHESNPAHIVRTINETTCQNNKTNMFVTLFIGVLDLPTGRLRYCNAGHDAPVVIDGTSVTPLPVKSNIPSGLFDDFEYEMQETILPKGSTLFLYTDGLTEARDTFHKQFGLSRVMQYLNLQKGASPQGIIKGMTRLVRQFSGEEEQSDDLTMLAIKYSPKTDDYTLHGELTMKNDVGELKNLHDFIKSVAGQLQIDNATTRKIRLAIEEAVVNIISYAYPPGVEGTIHLQAFSNSKCLKIVIIDSGAPFNPTEAAQADTTLSAEDRPIGGLGILLVRELMDSINYERADGKNILTVKKNLTR